MEDLSKDEHPCLVKGDFSIFHSNAVGKATTRDVNYTMDMDGVVVLSR